MSKATGPRLGALAFLCAGIALGVVGIQTLHAEENVKRVELQRADLTGTSGTEVIVSKLEIQPGGAVPRHLHHGDEFVYVIEGGEIQVPEKETSAFPSGTTLHFPRDMPHGGFAVVGDKPITVLTVQIVDKDKPLLEPAE